MDINNIYTDMYKCDECNYTCKHTGNWNKHLNTFKHINKITKSVSFVCNFCNITYKSRQGLWKHNKTCNKDKLTNNDDNTMKCFEILAELIDKTQPLDSHNANNSYNNANNSHNNTNNSHNNTTNNFNLQVYLNETCKDAMNLDEFIETIQVHNEDLEQTMRLGYVKGTTQIITKALNKLTQTNKPIQCSVLKRSTVYIKQNNVWNKDISLLEKGIIKASNKQINAIFQWKNDHQGCIQSDSKFNNKYLHILNAIMSGPDDDNYHKVANSILPHAVIDKHIYK